MSEACGLFTLVATLSVPTFQAQAPSSYPELGLRLTRYELETRVDYDSEQVQGTARLTLRNGSSAPMIEVPIVSYRLMPIAAVTDSGGRTLSFVQQVVAYEDDPKRQVNFAHVSLPAPLPPGSQTTVTRRPDLRTTPLRPYGRAQMTDFSYSMGMILFAVMHDLLGVGGGPRYRRVSRGIGGVL